MPDSPKPGDLVWVPAVVVTSPNHIGYGEIRVVLEDGLPGDPPMVSVMPSQVHTRESE